MSVLKGFEPANVLSYFEELCKFLMDQEIQKQLVIIVYNLPKITIFAMYKMNIMMSSSTKMVQKDLKTQRQ